MKFITILKATVLSAIFAATALFPATASAITPGSVAYNGSETSGPSFPAFNIFNGVPSVGNEADFIRVKKDGEANSTLRNEVSTSCKTGDRFVVWFYVHNGATADGNDNGNGPSVARNVVARVALPEVTGQQISGRVTASNAESINDTAVINCEGKQFKLKYVESSASAFLDQSNTNVALPRALVEGGTAIGTTGLDGNVWGCWNQRVWMSLKVEVEEVPVPQETPKSQGDCKSLEVAIVDNDKRKVSAAIANPTLQNAEVVGYKIDWGDGTVSDKQTDTHTYANGDSRKVTASVLIKYANGTTEWKTAEGCVKQVNFTTKNVTKPVTSATPTVLPNTGNGTGTAVAMFTTVTIAGALAHNFFQKRRFNS